MSKKFKNSKAEVFLRGFEDLESLDSEKCNLSKRCKFNFSYFDNSQEHSGELSEWDKDTICEFFNKLIGYSKSSLDELKQIGLGKNRYRLLSIYESFPASSNFSLPKNIPHQAKWGRIRLDSNKRLVGFIIPDEYHGRIHVKTSIAYDRNTFYVVFIDNHHNFYPLK